MLTADPIAGYTQTVLAPQLRQVGLNARQREVVAADVSMRLESLLFHWADVWFRRTLLVLGLEEASFWQPLQASLEVRALVVVAVRNSLVEDLGCGQAFTPELRSEKPLISDEQMPAITGAAIQYFQAANLDALQAPPSSDLFGELPNRFPLAWHVLSLVGNSAETEVACTLPEAKDPAIRLPTHVDAARETAIVESGIDPRINEPLALALKQVETGAIPIFFTPSFKGITREPAKLLAVIDHVLRHGGTLLTPNYLLSPTLVCRRDPLLRPAHSISAIRGKVRNLTGLTPRHREALAALS